MLAAGTGPDIVFISHDQIRAADYRNMFITLNDTVDPAWLRQTYTPMAATAALKDNSVLGLPFALQTITLIYNKALIDPADLARTTDELLDRAKNWTRTQYYFVYPAQLSYFSAAWFYGAGAWFVNEAGEVGIDTPGGLVAAQWMADLSKIMPAEADYVNTLNLFQNGQAAITLNGTWLLSSLKSSGIDYGLALIPAMGSNTNSLASPLVAVNLLAVTTLANQRGQTPAAVDLIRFLTTGEQQIRLAESGEWVPAAQAALDSPRVKALPVIHHMTQQALLGSLAPGSDQMTGLWTPLDRMIADIWSGRASPQNAIRQAQQDMEKLLPKK